MSETVFAYRYGFIGAGAMAEAIVSGMVQSGLCRGTDIVMSNRSAEKLERMHAQYGVAVASDNSLVMQQAEYIVLAVKPQQFPTMCEALQYKPGSRQTVVSIMAGISIAAIEEKLGDCTVFRVMPNTPAKIGWGMTGVSCTERATDEQRQTVQRMFDSVGKTVLVEEHYMDALGAVSGCGPAYMYQIIEALADGAVLAGLPRAMAYELAAQTMAGAAMMVLETGAHPGVLKDQVTSPGGTTIRGIQAMEAHGVRNAMIDAVQQAYIRSKELGEA